jgi:hypothetical protein
MSLRVILTLATFLGLAISAESARACDPPPCGVRTPRPAPTQPGRPNPQGPARPAPNRTSPPPLPPVNPPARPSQASASSADIVWDLPAEKIRSKNIRLVVNRKR